MRITKKMRREALIQARALLARPYGWVQGTASTDRRSPNKNYNDFAYCATGACRAAAPRDPDLSNRIVEDLRKEVPLQGKMRYSVVGFNDASKTRKKDILALFDRAIEKLA